MTLPEYLSGGRIQGRTTDSLAFSTGGLSAWKEIGRATAGGSTEDITATISDPKEHMMILASDLTDSSTTTYLRFGYNSIDTGSNYEFRGHRKAESDRDSSSNDTRLMIIDHNTAKQGFVVGNMINKASYYKLYQGCGLQVGATSSEPRNNEFVGKWQNNSNQANRVGFGAYDGSYNMASGSEVVVLGYDTDDTETTGGFWQSLANVTLTSAATKIDTGTFTAKKYLWVRVSTTSHSGAENDAFRFNNDTTSNAYRWQKNANGESTGTGAGDETELWGSLAASNKIVNTFIYNVASQQKMCTTELIESNTGGSPSKPFTLQAAHKWNNTSDAITSIQYGDLAGDSVTLGVGTQICVWGSD